MEVDVWEADEPRMSAHPAWNASSLSYEGRPNVVGVLRGSAGGRSILLNGHLDVVDAEPTQAWRHGPWDAAVSGDRLYGRGAADMKGGIASAISAVRALRSSGTVLAGDVIIELVVGEEEAMGNAVLSSVDRGISADACVFLEPTSLAVCPACRGGFRWRVEVEGQSVHGTRKWLGVDAVEKAIYIREQICSLERRWDSKTSHPLFSKFPLDIAVTPDLIRGGEWQGMVPALCVLEGYFEYLPGDGEDWESEFLGHIDLAAARDEWLDQHRPKTRITERFPAFATDSGAPVVETLQSAFEFATGRRASIRGFNSGCDAYARAVHDGSPTVIFGPGSLEHAHCVDEFVPLPELFACAETLAAMFVKWCGTAGSESAADRDLSP
jgi:acetylornithine deacetylase